MLIRKYTILKRFGEQLDVSLSTRLTSSRPLL
jgi:hypothetical protein